MFFHLCNKDVEYHCMLVYPLFQDLRRKYIKLHFRRNYSAFKYIQLMKTIFFKNPAKDVINIGKCICLTY